MSDMAPGPAAPSAAIRTTYSREFADGVSPEISVTMRQFYRAAGGSG